MKLQPSTTIAASSIRQLSRGGLFNLGNHIINPLGLHSRHETELPRRRRGSSPIVIYKICWHPAGHGIHPMLFQC